MAAVLGAAEGHHLHAVLHAPIPRVLFMESLDLQEKAVVRTVAASAREKHQGELHAFTSNQRVEAARSEESSMEVGGGSEADRLRFRWRCATTQISVGFTDFIRTCSCSFRVSREQGAGVPASVAAPAILKAADARLHRVPGLAIEVDEAGTHVFDRAARSDER